MKTNYVIIKPDSHPVLYENISFTDRSIRILLAIFFIGQVLLFDREVLAWQDYMVMLGVYLGMTAIMRWDPIYALFVAKTIKIINKYPRDYLSLDGEYFQRTTGNQTEKKDQDTLQSNFNITA